MGNISQAKRIDKMIEGLKELQVELFAKGHHYDGVIDDIALAIRDLDKVRMSLRG